MRILLRCHYTLLIFWKKTHVIQIVGNCSIKEFLFRSFSHKMSKFPDLYNLFHSHMLKENVRLGIMTHGFSLLMFNGQLENMVCLLGMKKHF